MQPSLTTERLVLRAYSLADAPAVQRLAGDARIADTTTTIPHPYPDGAAEAWIARHAGDFAARREVTFAVVRRSDSELLGTVSLRDLSATQARAELGYWIAVEHWGSGYCTEAVRRLIAYAQSDLQVTRIIARCMARNQASAKVMEKAGLEREGLLRRDTLKNGLFEDMLLYGLVLPGRGGA